MTPFLCSTRYVYCREGRQHVRVHSTEVSDHHVNFSGWPSNGCSRHFNKKQARKQNGSVALFNTPVFAVEIVPSAICHTNELGGSKTPQHYQRGRKTNKKKATPNTLVANCSLATAVVRRLQTCAAVLRGEQFKYYRFPGNSWKCQDLQQKTEIWKWKLAEMCPRKKTVRK